MIFDILGRCRVMQPHTIPINPFTTVVDASFWVAFSKRKIEVDKLDERSITLRGQSQNSSAKGAVPRVILSGDFSYNLGTKYVNHARFYPFYYNNTT